MTRPYPVTPWMVVLVSLVPVYLLIADVARQHPLQHTPFVTLDALIPLQPAWTIVYGALYLFLILLPVFIVQQPEHIRRTVFAYLTVWTTGYVCFLVYPTTAPRPAELHGDGFFVWGLRILYDSDPPFNCFPSIHVGHSFVSALTCYRVHRRVGIIAIGCASMVALSTLFTKQHYVLDVISGILLACAGHVAFLRSCPGDVPAPEREVAPALALTTLAIAAVGVAGFGVGYVLSQSGALR